MEAFLRGNEDSLNINLLKREIEQKIQIATSLVQSEVGRNSRINAFNFIINLIQKRDSLSDFLLEQNQMVLEDFHWKI